MSGTGSSLRRRLVKAEQQLADQAERAHRAWLANCNCKDQTFVDYAKNFEEEMNLRCPCHGFRRLGEIVRFDRAHPDARLTELIATYEAGLAQAESEQAHVGPES